MNDFNACGCRRGLCREAKSGCEHHRRLRDVEVRTVMRPSSGIATINQNSQNKNSSHTRKDYSKKYTTQYPTQAQRVHYHEPVPVCIIGHPSLKIYKFQLPPHLLHLLDHIVNGCDDYAATLPGGWMTYLYSLTKQDIAVRDVPGMYKAATPIISYVKSTIKRMYNAEHVKIDKNQPHVLRYSAEGGCKHTGVELHHDKCSLTANIMMSRSNAYVGGGTYFPDAKATVKLEFGEFLIHPGNLVHAGVDIIQGTRTLMILFTHVEERVESRSVENTTL
eukprot:scaffold15894_cov103-Skeletonema_marinoi.AAC.1